MASIGAGVREIRVRERAGAFRIIYIATALTTANLARATELVEELKDLSLRTFDETRHRPRPARNRSCGARRCLWVN